MLYTLELKKLPFKPDCNQIIYIEGQHDEEVNELIRLNFHRIKECFAEKNYDFCYIPYLKHALTTGERLHYNAPYAKSSREADFMVNDNFILDFMLHPENREKIPPSLLYFHPYCWDIRYSEAENQFRGIQISVSSFDGDNTLSHVLDDILKDIDKHRDNLHKLHFHKVSVPTTIYEDDSEEFEERENRTLYRETDDWEIDANYFFDEESRQLIEEIQERIEKLRLRGPESYLIELLFKNRKKKLSRLHITKDCHIYLPDYFGMEIKMTPLPKALFLLYLKHPEGIKFSYLPDFRDELLEIYKKVKGPFYNETTARKSIEDVTNPLSNSINEKCSRVREAFVSKFNDPLSHYYYIDGHWGEAKKIAIPRNMVIWEE